MSTDPAKPTAAAASTTSKLAPFFYEDQRGLLAILFLACMALVGAFVLWGLYERTIVPTPQVFPTTEDGKLTAPIPLSQPNLSTPELLQWTVSAITNAFTFNFVNYRKSLQEARSYFTQDAYMFYLKYLTDNGILEQVAQQKYILSVVPTSAPIILRERPMPDGTYAWQVQFPIRVNYHSARQEIAQFLVLTMLIQRAPIEQSRRGVIIAGIVIRNTRGP